MGRAGLRLNRIATTPPVGRCARVMTKHSTQGRLDAIGCAVSTVVSDLFANPLMQIGVILFCVSWFAFGLPTDLLTAALSILAITLTQMVLNRQNQREADAHRRDVALHAKLDELIIAKRGARDAMAGIEELEEAEIIALRENHHQQADELETAIRRRKRAIRG